MLKVQEIREIIKLIDQSDIEEFVYEHEGSKIELKKRIHTVIQEQRPAQVQPQIIQPVVEQAPVQPQRETTVQEAAPAAATQEQAEESGLEKIVSPMVGTFYQSPSPDSDAYVKVGSSVSKDSIVCIVEAMKLFNEIEAEIDGEIVEILVKDGELVEYGQPLFLVKPR